MGEGQEGGQDLTNALLDRKPPQTIGAASLASLSCLSLRFGAILDDQSSQPRQPSGRRSAPTQKSSGASRNASRGSKEASASSSA